MKTRLTNILYASIASLILVTGLGPDASAGNKSHLKNMVSFSTIQIKSCPIPFTIKILDKSKATFEPLNSSSSSLSVTDSSVNSNGIDKPADILLKTSGISEIRLELRSKGNSLKTWEPVRIGSLLSPEESIQNEFNPPNNASIKILKIPLGRLQNKTLRLEGSPKRNLTPLNPSLEDSSNAPDWDDEVEVKQTGRAHGFIDVTSVLILMFYCLLLVGLILLIRLILKKRKK